MTIEQLMSKVTLEKGPLLTLCWMWQGGKQKAGYGRAWHEGKQTGAHQLAYRLVIGPIPEGTQFHHRCEREGCCNPYHLDAMTRKAHAAVTDYSQNGDHQRRKTHCVHGHTLAGDNLLIKRDGFRRCRTCHRAECRERKQRKRQTS